MGWFNSLNKRLWDRCFFKFVVCFVMFMWRGPARMVVGINNYLCNQCISPLTLWIRISLMRGVLDTTLCDKVYQWLAAGRWFSPDTPVSSTNETDCHDITEILLEVALNTIIINWFLFLYFFWGRWSLSIFFIFYFFA